MTRFLLINLALILFSTFVYADEQYACIGKMVNSKNEKREMTIALTFEKISVVEVFIKSEDSTFTLKYNRENGKYKYYGDFGWDGYGGYVELRVPSKFSISGSDAMEEFGAQLVIASCSEIGCGKRDVFNGRCQREDN